MIKNNLLNLHTNFVALQTKAGILSENEKIKMQTDFDELNFLHLENFGNQLNIGIFICDINGTILYVNQTNEKLVGLSRTDCLGKNYKNFLFDNGISNVIVQQVLENKSMYSSLAFSHHSGIQLLETGAPIFNYNDELIGVIVIDQDITETQELAGKLRDSESKIAQYIELANHNSLVINQLNQQSIVLNNNFENLKNFITGSIKSTYLLALQASKTDVTILLIGETGTGKEVVANYIFENSKRNKNVFIKINCAAIPGHLLESELFGYVKGAFTGASASGKIGMFELANNGTLLLDEIGELPLEFQAKLLRALQQQEITRIGDTKSIKLDIRIIAATNRNLKEMVKAGTFREDLYYRLNIFPILIPELRERVDDIPDLANHFLGIFNKKYNKNIILCDDTLKGLTAYHWPGNIRELENIIERWIVIYDDYTAIKWDMVANNFSSTQPNAQNTYEGHTLKELLNNYEKNVLEWALKKGGTTRAAAAALHVDHSTIVRKAHNHGIVWK